MKEKLTRTSSCPQAWAWWESDAQRVAVLGYFRAYFKDGTWWNVFFPENMDVKTPELVKEFETVYEDFVRDFHKLGVLERFCRDTAQHMGGEEYHAYLELEHGLYWFRCRFYPGDYNLYLYGCSKAALKAGGVEA